MNHGPATSKKLTVKTIVVRALRSCMLFESQHICDGGIKVFQICNPAKVLFLSYQTGALHVLESFVSMYAQLFQ